LKTDWKEIFGKLGWLKERCLITSKRLSPKCCNWQVYRIYEEPEL